MAATREVVTWVDNFARAQILTTTPGENGWTIADTSSAGAPTYLCTSEDGGKLVLTLANDTEVENICAFHNDVLNFDLAKIQWVEIIAKVAGVTNTSVVTFGLGSARNDDEDAVATNAFFKIEGATDTANIEVESDDSVNDESVSSGVDLAAVYKTFRMDFSRGLSDVRFSIDGARVAAGTTFDMSNVTAGTNVQPYLQVSKTSAAGVAALHVAKFAIQYATVYGA